MLYIFGLVLKVCFKLILDKCNQDTRICKIFIRKNLESLLKNGYYGFSISYMLFFILCSININNILWEWSYGRDTITFISYGGFEVVFIQLVKLIIMGEEFFKI